MNINFENRLVFLSQPTVDFNGVILDGKGKMQALERMFLNLQEKHSALNLASERLMNRQKEDVINFLHLADNELMQSLLVNLPLIQGGLIDTLGLFLNATPLHGSMNITLAGATKNLEVYPEKVTFKETANIYLGDLGEDLPYTFVNVKIDQPRLVSSFSVYKNVSDISNVKFKNNNNIWEDYPLDTVIVQYQGTTFLDIETDEISFFVKNTKINNKYYCDLKVTPFYKKYEFAGTSFAWDKGLPINAIYANSLDAALPFYLDLKVIIDKREYSVQLPATNNALSRLEIEAYTSLGNNTETIFRCPYPVDFSQQLTLLRDIVNSADITEITGWQVSLDKINWKVESNANELIYGTDYSKKAKFTYFKVPGYYENAYVLYRLNKNVNSNWLITNNEVLFFNGTGIGINNKQGAPVRIIGNLYCFGSTSSDVFPIGVLGID